MRMLFALTQGIRHRRELRRLQKNAIACPSAISLEKLHNQGVRVLIWDFDGILSAHGALTPVAAMQPLLAMSEKLFGENRVFILSNKPLPARHAYITEHYPHIHFIYATKKKPYPDGIFDILALTKLPAAAHCLIDDRLLTGGLASILSGIRMVYCRHPFRDFHARARAEIFFTVLRTLERIFF